MLDFLSMIAAVAFLCYCLVALAYGIMLIVRGIQGTPKSRPNWLPDDTKEQRKINVAVGLFLTLVVSLMLIGLFSGIRKW